MSKIFNPPSSRPISTGEKIPETLLPVHARHPVDRVLVAVRQELLKKQKHNNHTHGILSVAGLYVASTQDASNNNNNNMCEDKRKWIVS